MNKEKDFINIINKILNKDSDKDLLVGIGDDAAVINFTEGPTAITTDLLIEGIHFDLTYMPLKHLGYKSVMVNLSDVYAMNVHPCLLYTSPSPRDS